jgi:exosortase
VSARLQSWQFLAGWLVAFLLFSAPLWEILKLSFTNEWYSHLALVLPITIGLLAIEMDPTPQPRNTVALALVAGLGAGAWWITRGQNLLWQPMLALVGILIGLFYAWRGAQATRAVGFPLMFLLFLIPVPAAWMEGVVHFLQQNSARATELLFHVLGVPAERNGFVFTLPALTIEVAEECSGIHSAITLFVASTLAAHLVLRTGWKQFLFVLAAIPVAILKNAIRIVTISGLTVYVDSSVIDGPLHHQGGPVFAVVGMVLMAPLLYVLWRPDGRNRSEVLIQSRDGRAFDRGPKFGTSHSFPNAVSEVKLNRKEV